MVLTRAMFYGCTVILIIYLWYISPLKVIFIQDLNFHNLHNNFVLGDDGRRFETWSDCALISAFVDFVSSESAVRVARQLENAGKREELRERQRYTTGTCYMLRLNF